jgi:hypothetical protein
MGRDPLAEEEGCQMNEAVLHGYLLALTAAAREPWLSHREAVDYLQ